MTSLPAWSDKAREGIEALYAALDRDRTVFTADLHDQLVLRGLDISLDEMLGMLIGGLRSGVVEFDFLAEKPGWRRR